MVDRRRDSGSGAGPKRQVEIFGKKRTTLLLLISLTLAASFSAGCTRQLPGARGIIILSDDISTLFQPSTGFSMPFQWPEPIFQPDVICHNDDKLVVVSQVDVRSAAPPQTSASWIYEIDLATWTADPVGPLNDSTVACLHLSFDSSARTYALSGRAFSGVGVYIMDTQWSAVNYISNELICESPGTWPNTAFRVTEDDVLLRCISTIGLFSLADRDWRVLVEGRLEDYCEEKNSFLYSSGQGKNRYLFELDLNDYSITKLPTGARGYMEAKYSPSGRYIVFSVNTYDILNTKDLFIFDIAHNDLIDMRFHKVGSLSWLDLPIPEAIVEASESGGGS